MDENLPGNSLSPSLDPGGCLSELNQIISYSSVITADFFGGHTANETSGQSMVWTDKKHNLYLERLETSFVKQLSRWLPQEKPHASADMDNTEDQFTVLQYGCLQKNFESIEPPLDSTADSEDILRSPCIRHFAPVGKRILTYSRSPATVDHSDSLCPGNPMNFSCKPACSSRKHPSCHFCDQSFGGFTHEVLDQNFEEESQEEKIKQKRSHESRGLGSKSDIVDNTSLDQVVPSGKTCSVDDSNNDNTCLKRGKKRLLSECSERLPSPKKSQMPLFFKREQM